jgi:transcriptional antiterminator RfaH
MKDWYVLHTKTGHERYVAVQLHQHQMDVFLPIVRICPANARAAREQPFFPGYLFARSIRQADNLDVLRWTPGVRTLVEFDGQVARVSDSFVAELRRRLRRVRPVADMVFDADDARGRSSIPGGPFAGFEGIFDGRLYGARRAQLLLSCIQNEHWRGCLAKAAAKHP